MNTIYSDGLIIVPYQLHVVLFQSLRGIHAVSEDWSLRFLSISNYKGILWVIYHPFHNHEPQ